MNDKGDELIRQAAELKAESEQLVAVSEGLAGRLPNRRKAGARERRPAPAAAAGTRGAVPAGTGPEQAPALPAPHASRGPGLPGGYRTGEVSVTRPGPWPGAGILDEEEAVTLAVLLEDLAARPGPDRLSGPALQAAALLRRRVTAGQRRGIRPRWGGPEARRETGDTRDGAADHRDAQALQRDRRAGERDDRATERDRQADAADEKARASDQRMLDRLRAADLREKAAAGQPPASDDAGRRHWPPDRDGAGAAPGCRDDREAIRELLAAALGARRAARHDRYAGGQDRVAARRDRDAAQADRQDAARDRQTARANRDQTVIESEEEDPRPGTDLA